MNPRIVPRGERQQDDGETSTLGLVLKLQDDTGVQPADCFALAVAWGPGGRGGRRF